MKRILLLVSAIFAIGHLGAQSIKGPDQISYFQVPAEGVKYEQADVYIMTDKVLEEAKLEAQKEKNSALGSKFGALGQATAGMVNKTMDYTAKISKAIDALKDDKGRFAVWNFVPQYIIANSDIKSTMIVEIYVLNDEDPSPSAGMSPLSPDKNGYYDIPYYINCRYKVTTPRGDVLAEENLGTLSGTMKSKNYKAPAPSSGGLMSVTVEESDELTESERIGISVAYNRVRQDIFGRFGFGTFSSPIKLGVIKEIKESKKFIEPVLSVFENKNALLLNAKEKEEVKNFVDIIESNLGNCTEKSRWVAYHNLSVCYAWLENPEKASAYYKKYGEEIKETIDEMAKWNLLLQGKLPKEDRKGLVIGMKDQKKFRNYKDIETFVTYYPAGAKRYEKLMTTINRDLGKFVDFYAHNDLLCSLYEIDYPFQFFPLQDFAGLPKKMEGTLTKEGDEPISFQVKFDSDRRIKQLETDQISRGDDGSKEKLFSRELKPTYDEVTGKFLDIVTDAGMWQKSMASNIYFSGKLNEIYDPLLKETSRSANNITKKAGIFSSKTSDEIVQLKVDLDGNIYFAGNNNYFKANAIFKDILTSNGIEAKRTDTKSKFLTKATINENGVFTSWSWDGDVTTSFGASFSTREQSIKATKLLREIIVLDQDDKGNPTKVKYNFDMKGSLNIAQKMSFKEWFTESYAQGGAPKNKVSQDSFEFGSSLEWPCSFKYDEQGNWIEMKVGPYTATRTFKY
ncbi:MAG: hypothetical protein M9948_08670 [Lentimicrobium sp.]|nr:hypothetical protein [Lentimicrobium sp.]